jgi:peptidylprolyl isomerase
MYRVRHGDRIRLHYTTTTASGGVLETSSRREPLELTVGLGEVVRGVDRALLGMAVGEKKRVPIMPAQAFGDRDPQWVQPVIPSLLPERLEDGAQLTLQFQDQEFPVWVKSTADGEIVLDANHPLAGETLVYELHVTSIVERDPSDSVLLFP